ncbi:MAG: hypothetical protein ABSE40_07020 [Candidatus Sulfotelmatobacter sp.]|jgi:hypothetical protein
MEAARKFIQTVRFILAGAVVMYALVILRLPSSATSKPIMLRALTVVAVSMTILIFVMRRIQVFPAEAILQIRPEDAKALARWRQGYLVTYALSLSIALYGLVLHFLGFSLSQVVPFFIAGFALILFLGPRAIPDSASPPQSGPITPR